MTAFLFLCAAGCFVYAEFLVGNDEGWLKRRYAGNTAMIFFFIAGVASIFI